MEYRKLGKTNLNVSKICLGTMTWGQQNTETEAHQQLDYALTQGINFIDTAELYAVPTTAETQGETERYIGSWLRKRTDRDQLVLATKMAGRGVDWIRNGAGLTPSDVRKAVEDSLQRLQTDYIDLYQLHWPQRSVPLWGKMNYRESMYAEGAAEQIEAILQALSELQKEGKIREVGLSNETSWGLMKYLQLAEAKGLPRVQSVQNAYSLLRREYETGLAEISMNEQVGLLAYSPLSGGILSGKYRNGVFPKGARFSTWGQDRMEYYFNKRSHALIEELYTLANELNLSLVQMSLAFVNDRGFVTSNIIGATSMEQLKECIGSAEVKLTAETYDRLDALFTQYPNPGTY